MSTTPQENNSGHCATGTKVTPPAATPDAKTAKAGASNSQKPTSPQTKSKSCCEQQLLDNFKKLIRLTTLMENNYAKCTK